MRVFIVHAYHEPASLNGALTREATTTLGAAGHEVVVSDLYAMGFDPVSDRRNFTTIADATQLKQQAGHEGLRVTVASATAADGNLSL
jgi:NAD(P)H dehydrogenase (quinone)